MAEGYILEETLGFVIKYLHEFEHVTKIIWDVEEEGIFREILESAPKKLCSTLLCANKYRSYGSMDTISSFQTLLQLNF
jgi:hypothetical protein